MALDLDQNEDRRATYTQEPRQNKLAALEIVSVPRKKLVFPPKRALSVCPLSISQSAGLTGDKVATYQYRRSGLFS
jgi:hypothetical protein